MKRAGLPDIKELDPVWRAMHRRVTCPCGCDTYEEVELLAHFARRITRGGASDSLCRIASCLRCVQCHRLQQPDDVERARDA